jgi:soluble lytic murein transglycosylase-like protein
VAVRRIAFRRGAFPRGIGALTLIVLAAACGSIAHRTAPVRTTGSVAPTPTPTPAPRPAAEATSPAPRPHPEALLPAPNAPIPRDPAALAPALTRTTLALRSAIDRWTQAGGTGSGPPPRAVVLLALYQQRVYRDLDQDPKLAARTIARLPAGLATEARTNVAAGTRLFSLVHRPSRHPPVPVRTRRPQPAGALLRSYQQAERRFGVPWEVLAAVNYIESKFGRVVSASSAGAQGPMQFIPSTWAAYGLGGDVHDPHDAILGAANYLHASGAPGDLRAALYSYNHALPYVSAVLLYARRMAHDPHAFFEYYNWQVFVLTAHGDERLTGPGLR